VQTFGPVGEEQVFIWEGFRRDDDLMEPRGVLRSFRLDPSTGQTRIGWEHAFPDASWGWADDSIAVSQDGRRVAQIEPDLPVDGPSRWRIMVADAGREWTPVTPFDSQLLLLPRWSPSGDALAYLVLTFGKPKLIPRNAVALSVPRPADIAAKIVLTPDGHASDEVAWAHDGRRLYLISAQPDVGRYLEAVDWPSLERRRLFAGAGLRYLSVARQTGDLVFVANADSEAVDPSEDDSGRAVWRLSPGGDLQKTPVTHTGALPPHVISPDGSRLAVVPRAEGDQYGQGLIVYSLGDGTAETFADLEGKSMRCIDWVLGGRAVLAVDSDERIWLIAFEGDLPEIVPVNLVPPLFSSFPPDPDQRSRNNLRKLARALLSYVAEHECMFPDLGDMEAVADALDPYLEGADVFVDPRTMQPYGANPSLCGKCDVDTEDMFDTVIFYETTPSEDGGRNLALIHGVVHHISAYRWQRIKKVSGIDE
jgi:hypothetical protein